MTFLFPVLIGIVPFHMALADSFSEEKQKNGDSLADIPSGALPDGGEKPLAVLENSPDVRPEEQGYIVLRDLKHGPINDENAPPLPLDGDLETREWVREALPRDSSYDTIRGYTTSHSLPTRGIIMPSPGLIMVHDADRKEEERLFFGVLSLTIRW